LLRAGQRRACQVHAGGELFARRVDVAWL
jgi:hypothetical protein